MHKSWSRWIQASLATHFYERSEGIPFFVEGQIRPSTIVDFAELRTDGPFFNEVQANYWFVDITVAILIQIVQGSDVHKLDYMIGVFAPAFTKAICMYRMGDNIDDDGEQFGSLRLRTEPGQRIRVDKFGQVQAATRIAQASIEGQYRMRLETA